MYLCHFHFQKNFFSKLGKVVISEEYYYFLRQPKIMQILEDYCCYYLFVKI
jgi:hypothetical protein